MDKAEKQLVKAFWLQNVDALNNGEMPGRLMERAYCCGCVVTDYHERVSELESSKIFEGAPEFVSSLTEDQLLGCIGYHFRADHFDNWHFYDEKNVLSVQRYVKAWLEKVSDLAVPPVDSIVYTFTACRVAPYDNPDSQKRVELSIGGEVKITERSVVRSTGRVIKGTTKTSKAFLRTNTAIELFTTLFRIPGVEPGQAIPLHACDALIDVSFKSKSSKRTKKSERDCGEETDAFLNVLFKALDEVCPDSEDDDD